MGNPKLSIIVPVYNSAAFLPKCLESILNQTYHNLELIVVNDGSTDTSPEICQGYAQKDDRIVYLSQNNQGQSVARNLALKHSTGTFISFIDSDDWIEPDMYKDMVGIALNQGLKVVECSSVALSRGQNYVQTNEKFVVQDQEQAVLRIIKNKKFAVWNRIYRADFIENMRFVPGKVFEDVMFTIAVFKKLDFIGFTKKEYYHYNDLSESTMRSNYSKKKWDSIGAGHYPLDQLGHLGPTIETASKEYLVYFLIYNYNQLFYDKSFDRKKHFRKKVKSWIYPHRFQPYSTIYANLAAVLPIWTYGLFLQINALRVSLKEHMLNWKKENVKVQNSAVSFLLILLAIKL